MIRVSESGQALLEPDVSDSESDGKLKVMIFNRPGVAGAVLQTAS